MEKEELLELIKAIFSSGFYVGLASGKDYITCYEFGNKSQEPQRPDKAWEEYVKPKLKNNKDMNTVNFWKDIF